MLKTKQHLQIMSVLLSLLLVVSLLPATAFAEESQEGESVIELFAQSNAEAVERFESTGNIDDLLGVNTYSGDLVLSAANLPSSYDLRNEGVVTSVKQQRPWGTCWGFGAIAAAEVSIMSEMGWTVSDGEIDLSELQLAWFAYTPLPDDAGSQAGEGNHAVNSDHSTILNHGGLPFTATSVFSSGIGPVNEVDIPYRNKEGYIAYDSKGDPVNWSAQGDWSVEESLRFAQTVELEHSSILPSPATRDAQDDYVYNETGTVAIKQEILEGRAVEIGFSADTSKPGQTNPPKYINTDTWAHYTYEEDAPANHAVTIVGWDDDYDASNFLAGHQPPDNGAWIIKNSWGSKTEPFPNYNPSGWGVNGEGFFYLSYYDMSISSPESFDFYVQEYESGFDYYLIDQYDFMPSFGVRAIQTSELASMANVFMAEERQRVRSLSCETESPNTTVTYQLYLLNEGYSNPEDGELLATLTEAYEYAGYHRAQLGEGFIIEQGQEYSVVATHETGSAYAVSADKQLNRAGMDFLNSFSPPERQQSLYAVGVINRGESYLLSNGSWSDWVDEVAKLKAGDPQYQGQGIFDYDNFPIKAYADPLGPAPGPTPTPTPTPKPGGIPPTGDLSAPVLAVTLSFALLGISVSATVMLRNRRQREYASRNR